MSKAIPADVMIPGRMYEESEDGYIDVTPPGAVIDRSEEEERAEREAELAEWHERTIYELNSATWDLTILRTDQGAELIGAGCGWPLDPGEMRRLRDALTDEIERQEKDRG